MQKRTPVFIVCSARPRVGKTLVARALAEFFQVQGRVVSAFDVNPDQFALVDHLPSVTAVSTISDVRGQMALFDQIVAGDLVPKVVDLGAAPFEPFFSLVQELDFVREARRRGVAPTVLFVADGERRSRQGYAMLRDRFPDLTLVPVLNEANPPVDRYRDQFPVPGGGKPVTIPALAAVIRHVIERPGFTFLSYASKAPDTTSELYGWTRRVFMELRELELRLMLEEIKPSLRFSA